MDVETRVTLLERLRDGADQLSWEEFFYRYWPVVFALARRRGCSDQTAEEVVQDVMLKMFQERDFYQYDPARGRFRAWLATLVRNRVAEYRRRPSERARPRGGDADGAQNEPAGKEAEPDSQSEASFEEALLLVLLDVVRREVDPRTFLAFELLALQQLSAREVSKITGLSRNAAYKARRRVTRRLKELGSGYRTAGQLTERLKHALATRPEAVVERSVTGRMERTIWFQ